MRIFWGVLNWYVRGGCPLWLEGWAEAQSKDTGVAKVSPRVLYFIGNPSLAGTPKDHWVQPYLHTRILNAWFVQAITPEETCNATRERPVAVTIHGWQVLSSGRAGGWSSLDLSQTTAPTASHPGCRGPLEWPAPTKDGVPMGKTFSTAWAPEASSGLTLHLELDDVEEVPEGCLACTWDWSVSVQGSSCWGMCSVFSTVLRMSWGGNRRQPPRHLLWGLLPSCRTFMNQHVQKTTCWFQKQVRATGDVCLSHVITAWWCCSHTTPASSSWPLPPQTPSTLRWNFGAVEWFKHLYYQH